MKTYTTKILALLLLLAGVLGCKKQEGLEPQAQLQISSYYPNSGKAGTLVTIEGEGFGKQIEHYRVTVGSTQAEVIGTSGETLVVRMPENGSSGTLVLTHRDQPYEIGPYTYQDLSVQSIYPSNGPAGSQIRITGEGFGSVAAPAKVFINEKAAQVISVSDTLVVAEVPDEAGYGPVMVQVDGKEAKGQDFTYQAIYEIKPLTGGKNTRVTIKGVGFEPIAAGNVVDFNGKLAEVVESDGEQLVVIAPDGVTTGPLSVSIHGQKTTGPAFTVVPFPLIKAVTPLSGPAGEEMTITGDYYSALADEIKVTINGVPAVVSSASEKRIVVQIPANAGKGKVMLSVNDQQTAGPEFTEQNLGIVQLWPDNGLEGEEVVITGIGFSTVPEANSVSFGGQSARVVSASDTELTVVVPQGVATGAVNVQVGNLTAKGPQFYRAGVMTLAGGPGSTELQGIMAVAVDSKGNVFAAVGNRIKKITPGGAISDFAGSTEAGAVDNVGSYARFNYIVGLAIAEDDNLYVADRFNNRIRKVTPAAVVSTVATPSFPPISLSADREGNIYAGQSYGGVHILNKVTGGLTKIHNAMHETGDYITAASPAEVYYAPGYTDYLRVFGIVNNSKITFAGNGGFGLVDGPAASASFRGITGLAINEEKVLYVLDANGGVLRKIEEGMVTTLAGTKGTGNPQPGHADGSFRVAQFGSAQNMCLDNEGNLYIAERGINNAIRKVFFK